MAFEKTWAFDMNRAYTPASAVDLTRWTMWYLASVLTGNIGGLSQGLWTLYASSDSVTAGTDSTDRWVLAGPYDGTKIVRGSGSNAHSWIVLRSPSINGDVWYMILSFNSASDDKIRISFTKTAPTGGTTTATPTAADQWWPNAATAVDWTLNAAAADASRFSVGLTSGGDFYLIGCKQLANVPNLSLQFHGLSNRKAGDLYPVWAGAEYNAVGVLRISATAGSMWVGSPSGAVGGTVCRHPITSASTSNPLAYWNCNPNGSPATWAPSSADIGDGTYPDLPLWAYASPTAGSHPQGIRGRIADLAISPSTPATLPEGVTVSPSTGQITSCKVGNLWLPASAAFNFF